MRFLIIFSTKIMILFFLSFFSVFMITVKASDSHVENDCDIFNADCRFAQKMRTTYPVSEMNMLGSITQSGETVAMILLPDHQVILVSLYQLIGSEFGKIIAITPEKISVKIKNTLVFLKKCAG